MENKIRCDFKRVLTQFSKNKFSYLLYWKYLDLLFGIYPGFFSLAPILGAPKRHNSSGFKTLLSEQLTFRFFKVVYIRFAHPLACFRFMLWFATKVCSQFKKELPIATNRKIKFSWADYDPRADLVVLRCLPDELFYKYIQGCVTSRNSLMSDSQNS